MVEPKQDDLKRTSSLLKEVVTKAKDEALATLLKKVASAWTELVSAACALIAANAQLKSTVIEGGQKIHQFFEHGGFEKLQAVALLRKKLGAASNKIENIPDAKGQVKSTEALEALLKMRMPDSFATELQSESFDDLAAYHATSLASSLLEKRQKLLDLVAEKRTKRSRDNPSIKDDSSMSNMDYILQWSAGKETYWGKRVAPEDSLEQIESIINDTIAGLPALPAKLFCQTLSEDRHFCQIVTVMVFSRL